MVLVVGLRLTLQMVGLRMFSHEPRDGPGAD